VLVIDASVALSWCFEDEATAATDALVLRVRGEGAIVPSHWALEVLNALGVAERRGRIGRAEATAHVRTIEDLGVDVDEETPRRALRDTLALARAEKLSLYDAAYLELAFRRGLTLATLDRTLAKAATRSGVAVVP
jgi:predicted nucleic acid-binding protein